jgi:hypothetical protein
MNRQEMEAWLLARSLRRQAAARAAAINGAERRGTGTGTLEKTAEAFTGPSGTLERAADSKPDAGESLEHAAASCNAAVASQDRSGPPQNEAAALHPGAGASPNATADAHRATGEPRDQAAHDTGVLPHDAGRMAEAPGQASGFRHGYESTSEMWDGRPRQSRRSAPGVDIRTARGARWPDTVGLIDGHAPDYLVPLLAYALGMKRGAEGGSGGEPGGTESESNSFDS